MQYGQEKKKVAVDIEYLDSMRTSGGTVDRKLPASAEVRVQSLAREDSTRRRATKPASHNYFRALEPASRS